MYNLKYQPQGGKIFDMSFDNDIIIVSVKGVTGISTNLKTSQGFQQIGENVDSSSIGGRDLVINGYILDANTDLKMELIKTFAPMTRGRLFWEDEYFVDVYVKKSPDVNQEKHSKFSLTVFAPYPFWQRKKTKNYKIGLTTSNFSYPIDKLNSHILGTRAETNAVEIKNSGDMPARYIIKLTAGIGGLKNPRIVNVKTLEYIGFKGVINEGNIIHIFYDENEFRIVAESNGTIYNAFNVFDESSSLYQLPVGTHILRLDAESGSNNASAEITYNETFSGVLADGV